MLQKEGFRKKVGMELTFLKHRLYQEESYVCVCFSHAVLWSLWATKPKLPPTVSPESGTGPAP